MKKFFLTAMMVVFGCCCLFSQTESVLKKGAELEKAGKLDEALEVYKEGLKSSPSEELYRKIGAILGKEQKYAQAEELLKEGMTKFPESTSVINLAGFIQFKQGNQSEALNLWKKVLAKDPKNSFANEWVGKVEGGKTTTVSATPATSSPGNSAPTKAGEGLFKPDFSLPLEEQEKLALKLYEEMTQMDSADLDAIESHHRKVIEKCPQTKRAEESLWKLNNLYSTAKDEADYEKISQILEYLIKQYPNSELVPAAKNHLIYAYEQTKAFDKLVPLYEELYQRKEGFSEGENRATTLGYADALAGAGRKAEARVLYEEIIKKWGSDEDCIEAALAMERLKNL